MRRADADVADAFEAMLAQAEQAEADSTEGALAKLIEGLTLEQLAADLELGALPASDVQRALMRAADGRPLDGLLDEHAAQFHFLCPASEVGRARPRYVIVRGGVRSGKSLIAAIAMVLSALRCTLRRPADPKHGEIPGPDGLVGVRPGEFVRVVVVAPQKSLTRAAFTHAVSLLQRSAVLRPLLESDPRKESFTLRRPDGQLIELMIVAASGAGATLRSTWLAGVFFDEADFHKDGEAAVNLGDNFKAVKARLLPGAQAWVVSSPWCEGTEFDEIFTDAYGRPGRELAFHSTSRAMNPTLDREEEAAERAKDPDNAAREYDAIPLTTVSNEFFPKEVLAVAVNKARIGEELHLAPNGQPHYAGVDLGFRRNSSAIALARGASGKAVLAFYDEKRPTPTVKLKPSAVLESFAEACHAFDARSMLGDLHYADTAHEELAKHRSRTPLDREPWTVSYAEYDSKALAETCSAVLLRMKAGGVELPDDPRLLQQFRGVKRRVMPGGVVSVALPKSHGAHADVLVACLLALVQVPVVHDEGLPELGEADVEALLGGGRWGSNDRGFG